MHNVHAPHLFRTRTLEPHPDRVHISKNIAAALTRELQVTFALASGDDTNGETPIHCSFDRMSARERARVLYLPPEAGEPNGLCDIDAHNMAYVQSSADLAAAPPPTARYPDALARHIRQLNRGNNGGGGNVDDDEGIE